MRLISINAVTVSAIISFAGALLASPMQGQTLFTTAASSANPDQRRSHGTCTDYTFSGSYLYLTSGFQFLNGSDGSLPFSYPVLAIGKLTIDASNPGRSTARQILSGNDQILEQSFSARLITDATEPCLRELVLTRCPEGICTDVSLHLAVSSDGDEAFIVAGQENQVQIGHFLRVSTAEQDSVCSNSTLRGDYRFQTFGFGFDSTIGFQSTQAYPFSSAGIVTAENGNFSFHDWGNFALIAARRNYPAIYQIDSSCSGELRQPDPTYPTARILASGDGETFALMQLTPDAPVIGIFKRQ